MAKKEARIIITKNGPYLVSGNLPMEKEIIVPGKDGIPIRWEKGEKYPAKESCYLCRCGHSKNKPYCDGTHAKVGFNGEETAGNKKYLDMAETTEGPEFDLKDAPELCASARFCDRAGGIWQLTADANNPKTKKIVMEEAYNCPAGRLVIYDKQGKPIDPALKPSISLVEDPMKGVSGPIWVKGGVQIESDGGKTYEVRNRVALCRCGKSTIKPYCDGNHIPARFTDGDKSLR